MRSPFFTTLMAVAVLGACQAPAALTDSQRDALAADVNQAAADLYEAMNAHDVDRVLGHYVPTDAFRYVGVSDVMYGYQVFESVTRPWYRANPDVTFEHTILDTRVVSPTVAIVIAQGSSTVSPHLMWTRVFVLQDGTWLIALEHESWPGADSPTPPHPLTGE